MLPSRNTPAPTTQPLLATLRALAAFLRPPPSPAAELDLWPGEVVQQWAEDALSIAKVL